MITILLTAMGATITVWASPAKKVWSTTMTKVSFIFLLSSFLYSGSKKIIWNHLSFSLTIDKMSTPLMLLSCWLMPVSLLASTKALSNQSIQSQQSFMVFNIWMLMALIMTFSTTSLIVFFMAFEATLMPTLLIISRWGMQKERIEASYYFMFYTLVSSLPLFIGLLMVYLAGHETKIILKNWSIVKNMSPTLVLFCMLAFLVKVPIFTFHLWLPKAHVEAPVAGSMILAAVLLKMGGYGFIRIYIYFWESLTTSVSLALMMFCCWGGILTSLICVTQTDLKSLMAYSSVSHMSFMIAGMSTGTEWGIKASVIIMVAHGMVSSALFALAKMSYERSGTRTLIMKRSLKATVSLLPLFWLLFVSAKLGLPPLPKAMGEIMTFSSIMNWSLISYFPMALGVVFTSMFSLTMYQLLKSGWAHKWKKMKSEITQRESLMMALHLIPLMLVIFNPKILTYRQ